MTTQSGNVGLMLISCDYCNDEMSTDSAEFKEFGQVEIPMGKINKHFCNVHCLIKWLEREHPIPTHSGTAISLVQLRELVAIQAEDDALWAPASRVETAYTQQALRYLTRAIEGDWTFEEARDAIQEMMP